jgi:hypothetical protein
MNMTFVFGHHPESAGRRPYRIPSFESISDTQQRLGPLSGYPGTGISWVALPITAACERCASPPKLVLAPWPKSDLNSATDIGLARLGFGR